MNRQRLLAFGLLFVAALVVIGLILAPRFGRPRTLTGYVEGEPLYIAGPVAGAVKAVFVERGAEVAAGAPLFVVDPDQPRSQRDQAIAELAAAEAQARDARKGQRPVELAVLKADVARARARAQNAEIQFRRAEDLARAGVASRAQLDDARAAAEQGRAELAEAQRRLQSAGLGARQDQIRAADARVAQARAALAGAEARLNELSPRAPAKARVEDVFYYPGEWVAANQPVLSLLPDERIKLRFFVPEAARAAYRPGRLVRFSCDGCARGLTARVVFVSPRAEFTPPVIYSREARDRLVYLVEARPSVRLDPGQPVDVEPLEPAS